MNDMQEGVDGLGGGELRAAMAVLGCPDCNWLTAHARRVAFPCISL
jgi:hypothetical protein